MKILVVGNYFYPEHIGGVEIVSYNLVRYYRESGHHVRWVAADVPPRFRKATDDDLPIRSWNITEEQLGFPNPIPCPGAMGELYRGVKWCDVVHLQDCLYLINIIVFVISKILKKTIIITQHTEVIPYKSRLKNWLQSSALLTIGVVMHKFANKSVFISENTRDHMPFITGNVKNPAVVRNGVDTEFFKPLPPDIRKQLRQNICGDSRKPVLLFAGRFVAIKGIHHLIPIIERHQEWHWLLVGRPDEYDPASWNYSNITYWPSLGLDEMRKAYAIADISIHPSEVVGMSLTILECMACGTPVVINESVLYGVPKEDLEYFILVKPETERIENAIISLLKNRRLLKARARKVRGFSMKQSNWSEVAKKYLTIFETLNMND